MKLYDFGVIALLSIFVVGALFGFSQEDPIKDGCSIDTPNKVCYIVTKEI